MKNSNGIANYSDIVNRRTLSDELGDAFINQSNKPTYSGNQRFSSAISAGLGAGFKGSANAIREMKLRELEEATKQTALIEAAMQTEAAINTRHKLKLENFVITHKPELKLYNDAVEAEDYAAQNKILATMFAGFKRDMPEIAEQYGEFSHSYDNHIFFKKDGNIIPVDRKSLFLQLPLESLGDEARELENITSNYTNTKFERSDIDWSNKTLSEVAKLENTKADTNLKNAQTEHHLSQANEPKRDPIAEHTLKETINYNNKWLEKNNEIKKDLVVKNEVLTKMEKILYDLKGDFLNGTGTGTWNAFARYYNKQRNNPAGEKLSEAEYLMKYFFADIKGVAGNPNQKEWGDLMLRIINTSQNEDATLRMIDFERQKNNEEIFNFDETSRYLSSINYRLPYHDPIVRDAVQPKIEARQKEFIENHKKVIEKIKQDKYRKREAYIRNIK